MEKIEEGTLALGKLLKEQGIDVRIIDQQYDNDNEVNFVNVPRLTITAASKDDFLNKIKQIYLEAVEYLVAGDAHKMMVERLTQELSEGVPHLFGHRNAEAAPSL